jgi:hypothetical protein
MPKDFVELRVRLGGLAEQPDTPITGAYHVFYLREHAIRKDEGRFPPHRTVFVANVPCFIQVSPLSLLYCLCDSSQNGG